MSFDRLRSLTKMVRWVTLIALVLVPVTLSAEVPHVIVVVGAGGADEYDATFRAWSDQWMEAARRGTASIDRVGSEENTGTSDREQLLALLEKERTASGSPLWIVLLGHGTFDGMAAKFNLRGPDLSSAELATALADFKRPLVIVNCSSASGPFINALSGPNRVVITATKSGFEQNYARFGEYFAAAILDSSGDLDKDDQVSVLEAFVAASRRVAEYYASEHRLATEHAILDDNGDQLGTPAEWFKGPRAERAPREGHKADGARAHQQHLIRSPREQSMSLEQRAQRDALEQQLEMLRGRKSELASADYDVELERILLQLAELYEAVDAAVEQPRDPP